MSSFTNDAGYLTSHQDISGKADKATTLAGYGITDAKIASGTITLGSNSITPLTEHQSLADYTKTEDLAAVATSGSYNDLSNTPTIPDVSSFAQTGVANTWTAAQVFSTLGIDYERYGVSTFNGTSATPTTSVAWIIATGAFTLDMSSIASALSNGQGTVFTAVLAATSDYALTITNAGDSGNIRYCGSASDIAIKSTGTLVNIFLAKNSSGTLTSIVQAITLSAS